MAGRDTELLGIDRRNEAHNTAAAAETGVGARVIATLPEHQALVIEFIEGTRLHAEARTALLEGHVQCGSPLLRGVPGGNRQAQRGLQGPRRARHNDDMALRDPSGHRIV